MSVMVRIPNPLRKLTNEEDKVSLEGSTLQEILDALETKYPGIKERLCEETGELRNFVNVYINGGDSRFLDGLSSSINPGDEISIVPAVAGGS